MQISRQFEVKNLNWSILPVVLSMLTNGSKISDIIITVDVFPDTITFDNIEDSIAYIKANEYPSGYRVYFRLVDGNTFSINKASYLNYITVEISNLTSSNDLKNIQNFLN